MLSQGLALLGTLTLTALLMASVIECPALALVICAVPTLVGLGCTYICGDERGFLTPSYCGRVVAELDRMEREPANQGPIHDLWSDY